MKAQFRRGFTLLELLMSITVLGVMLLLSFICFDAVVQSWTVGQEVSDAMSQADYVMNQIESGLRSACYIDKTKDENLRGFKLIDGGEGADAADVLEWTKLGRAIVGDLKDDDGLTRLAQMPHSVRLFVEGRGRFSSLGKNAEEGEGLFAKAWIRDFRDPNETDDEFEDNVREYLISDRVVGLDCKVLEEPPTGDMDKVEFEETWSKSNALPYKVSVTLYLKGAKEDDDPIPLTRDIEIPAWYYSQHPESGGESGEGGKRRAESVGTGGKRRAEGGGSSGGGRRAESGGNSGGGRRAEGASAPPKQ